jgi:hypothetical protein
MTASQLKSATADYVNKAPLREGIRPWLPSAAQRKFSVSKAPRETFLSTRVIVALKVTASFKITSTPRAERLKEKFTPRTLSVNQQA